MVFLCFGTIALARGSVAFGDFDLSVQATQGVTDIAMDSDFTSYTWIALALELTFSLLAGICLLRND